MWLLRDDRIQKSRIERAQTRLLRNNRISWLKLFFNRDGQLNFFTRAISTPWSNKDKSCRRYQLCNNFYRRYSINPSGLAEGGLTRGGECYRIFCLARKLSTLERCIARSLLLWLAEDLIFLSCYSKACTPPWGQPPSRLACHPVKPATSTGVCTYCISLFTRHR